MFAKHVINNVVNLMVEPNPTKVRLNNIRWEGMTFSFNAVLIVPHCEF